MEGAILAAAAFMAVFVYFLPTVVAAKRGHQSGASIFVVNLFFGWTLLGWVAALAWALAATTDRGDVDPAVVRYVERQAPARPPEPVAAGDPLAGGRPYRSWVAGLKFADGATGVSRAAYAAARVQEEDELVPVREPLNPHDPRAVRLDHAGFALGYLPRRHDWIAAAIDEGKRVRIFVDEVDVDDPDEPRVMLEVIVWR